MSIKHFQQKLFGRKCCFVFCKLKAGIQLSAKKDRFDPAFLIPCKPKLFSRFLELVSRNVGVDIQFGDFRVITFFAV